MSLTQLSLPRTVSIICSGKRHRRVTASSDICAERPTMTGSELVSSPSV